MRKIILTLTLAALWCPVKAEETAQPPVEPEAMWLRLYTTGEEGLRYIDITREGDCLYYTETKNRASTLSGNIGKKLAKEMFQEVENSYNLVAAQEAQDSYLSLEGAMAEISASRDGQLETTYIKQDDLPEGIKLATEETEKAAKKIKTLSSAPKLITAYPLSKKEIAAVEKALGRSPKFVFLETSDMETVPELAKAVFKPRRMVALQNQETKTALDKFLLDKRIRPDRGFYYISTTRGDFRFQLVYANR